jgi:hypothetical protein
MTRSLCLREVGTGGDLPSVSGGKVIVRRGRSSAVLGLCLAVLASACAASTNENAANRTPRDDPGSQASRTAAIYAAAIRKLVTEDHTFGGADPGFKVVYVIDGPVPHAEDPSRTLDELRPAAPFGADVKRELVRELAGLPPLRFVPDRGSVVAGEPPGHVINGGVLLTLSSPTGADDKVRLGNSLWINGLAGTWQTYILERRADGWRVTGRSGPVAIS